MISEVLAVLETEEQRNELAAFYEKNKSRFYAIAFGHLHKKKNPRTLFRKLLPQLPISPEYSTNNGAKIFQYLLILYYTL